MILLIWGLLLSGIIQASPVPEPKWAARFPNWMLTPDYGILKEKDFLLEMRTYNTFPYDPAKGGEGAYWQCFNTQDVRPQYRTWENEDDFGKPTDFCEMETWARRDGEIHSYGDRSGHPLVVCQSFMKAWKKSIRGERYVCFTGEFFRVGPEKENGTLRPEVHQWTWNKFKTKKGCYGYFSGDCSP